MSIECRPRCLARHAAVDCLTMNASRIKARESRSWSDRYEGTVGWVSHCSRLIMLCAIALTIALGCSQKKQRYKPAVLATESDVAGYVQRALEHKDADVRRGAIRHIAKTRHADLPIVVDGLTAAARNDPSESVRCAAIRALGKLEDQRAVETTLVLLSDPAEHPTVRPAGADLRWEAIQVLHEFVKGGIPDRHERNGAQRIAIRLLLTDPSRDVRIEAARLLGLFPTTDAARALIEGLRQRDFGIVYESERSLMRLTGRTRDHDPTRWESWLNSTPEPFADGGALDDVLDPPPRRRWWPWKKPS